MKSPLDNWYGKNIKGFLLLFFICVSCDFSTPFLIEGGKEYTVSTGCGRITIKGSSFSTTFIIGCRFDGHFSVNPECLRIEPSSSEVRISNIRFLLNLQEITEKTIKTVDGDVITVIFSLQSNVPCQSPIRILPSDFILCENKPIIVDTLKIQYLDKSDKTK